MIVCKKCGTELIDEAVFCSECGSRVDGKKPCVACGKLNGENARFCVYCGTRIDGKRVCNACGTEFEGNFCPACGTCALPAAAMTAPKPYGVGAPMIMAGKPSKQKKEGAETWKKVVELVSGGFGMLAVLTALIFVFFIGVAVNGLAVGDTSSMVCFAESPFYFFGKVFTDIEKMGYAGKTDYPYPSLDYAVNVYALMGLLSSLLSIVLVLTFSTLAIVFYVLNLCGKSTRSPNTFIVLTAISFFLGAGGMLSLHNFSTDLSLSSSVPAAVLTFGLNGATVAGIVVCAIALAAFFAGKIVVKGKEMLQSGGLIRLIFVGVGILLTTLVFIFTENAGITVLEEVSSNGLNKSTLRSSGSFFRIIFTSLPQANMGVFSDPNPYIDELEMAAICGGLAQMMTTFVLIVTAFLLGKRLCSITSEQSGAALGLSITTLVLATFAMVFAVMSSGALNQAELLLDAKISRIVDPTQYTCGQSVAAFVFALLNLGISIVQKILWNNAKKKQEFAPVQQPVPAVEQTYTSNYSV